MGSSEQLTPQPLPPPQGVAPNLSDVRCEHAVLQADMLQDADPAEPIRVGVRAMLRAAVDPAAGDNPLETAKKALEGMRCRFCAWAAGECIVRDVTSAETQQLQEERAAAMLNSAPPWLTAVRFKRAGLTTASASRIARMNGPKLRAERQRRKLGVIDLLGGVRNEVAGENSIARLPQGLADVLTGFSGEHVTSHFISFAGEPNSFIITDFSGQNGFEKPQAANVGRLGEKFLGLLKSTDTNGRPRLFTRQVRGARRPVDILGTFDGGFVARIKTGRQADTADTGRGGMYVACLNPGSPVPPYRVAILGIPPDGQGHEFLRRTGLGNLADPGRH